MFRYRLHTLLILMAFVPPVLAACWWAFTGGDEETAVFGGVVFTAASVWLGSRAVIFLNTRI
jgi:hypothetical protein